MRLLRRTMSPDDFWSLIATMNGRTDEAAVQALTDALSARPKRDVRAFAERLARVLYDLDRQVLFQRPVRFVDDPDPDDPENADVEPLPMSDDTFLYLRAGLVARGRETVEAVLARPETLDDGVWEECEDLLYVAEEVLEDDVDTKVSYETASNREHWDAPHELVPDGEPWLSCWIEVRDLGDPIEVIRQEPGGPEQTFVDYPPPLWLPRSLFSELGRDVERLVNEHGGVPAELDTERIRVSIDLGDTWQPTPVTSREEDAMGITEGPLLVSRVHAEAAFVRALGSDERRVLLNGLAARCVLAVLPADHGARPGLLDLQAAADALLPDDVR